MKRRDLLTAALAAPLAAVPAVAVTETDTPILRLYREFNRITEQASAFFEAGTGVTGPDEDELLDRLFYNRRDTIEAEMMALPCTCAADFAAKVIVDTVKGELFSDWDTGSIWAEARALVA